MIGKFLAVFLILKALLLQVSLQSPAYDLSETLHCYPQKTPLYGKKWCRFNRAANELGAECNFTCTNGYVLKGPSENKCMLTLGGQFAQFLPIPGTCELAVLPTPLSLTRGRNGPYHLHAMADAGRILTSEDLFHGRMVSLPSPSTFYINKPGANGVEGTVSFSLSAYPEKYLIQNGVNLMMPNSSNISENTESWQNDSSFWIRTDQFYQGYFAFESYTLSHYFINLGRQGVTLQEPVTEEDYRASSFKWESISD